MKQRSRLWQVRVFIGRECRRDAVFIERGGLNEKVCAEAQTNLLQKLFPAWRGRSKNERCAKAKKMVHKELKFKAERVRGGCDIAGAEVMGGDTSRHLSICTLSTSDKSPKILFFQKATIVSLEFKKSHIISGKIDVILLDFKLLGNHSAFALVFFRSRRIFRTTCVAAHKRM
jgi:hypothetical protein